MVYRDLIVYIRETALGIVLKAPDTPKHRHECFLNPPCGCSNPGKDIQCEDCPYLEACLSRFKTISSAHKQDRTRLIRQEMQLKETRPHTFV